MKRTSTIALPMFILAAPSGEARRRAAAPVPTRSLAIEIAMTSRRNHRCPCTPYFSSTMN
ncbi:MAG: hypothetical protein JO093_14150 [Acidobacteria bacterium]|nr:hypothetical protein [Acidobacteriota bacterium]MBV9067887.1 hypothetical protein [Acidobacteriota bacterium]MBV9186758.1 hypothetical protein [Acidobacteriota bacterium]